jgi:hypothetical protein
MSIDSPNGSAYVDLTSVGRQVIRRWPLIVALAVVGALVGWLWASQSPKSYVAEATVALGPAYVAGSDGLTTSTVNTATERQVALSGAVIEPLLPTAGGSDTVGGFRSRAAVATPPDSTTLVLTVSGSVAETTAQEVTDWAEGLLAYRADVAAATVASSVDRLDRALTTAQRELARATRNVALAPDDSVASQSARAERDLAQAQVAELQAQRTALATASPPQDRLLGQPQVPDQAQGFGTTAWALVGAILGGLLGLLLALVRGTRRSTIDAGALPPDLEPLVVGDLSQGGSAAATELQALATRLSRLPQVAEHGIVLASGAGVQPALRESLAEALRQRGVQVEALGDDAAAQLTASDRPQVVLASPDQRDPWLSVLAPGAASVLLLAEQGTTDTEALRGVVTSLGRAGAHPAIVLVGSRPARTATPSASGGSAAGAP